MLSLKKFKLDFVIIGVQKGGTTALDKYLRKHPDIEMGDIKELHFFDNDSLFLNKKVNYNIYHNHFNKSIKNKLFGEATPIYFFWENALERIYRYNKKIKLILILRNPIDRAFSHWNMEVSRGNEDRDFNTCIKDDIQNSYMNDRIKSYVSRGFYAEGIIRLKKLFKKEQLLILKYDDFLKEQESSLSSIFNFLNVNPDSFQYEFNKVHETKYNKRIHLEDKLLLKQVFLKDIEKVEELLDWDCTNWKTI